MPAILPVLIWQWGRQGTAVPVHVVAQLRRGLVREGLVGAVQEAEMEEAVGAEVEVEAEEGVAEVVGVSKEMTLMES